MNNASRQELLNLIKENIAVIISMVFGMQMLRVLFLSFVGYLRDSVGISALDLAPVAVGLFALSLLSGVWNRLFGSRRAVSLLISGLALLRIGEQIARDANADLILSAFATLFFLWLLPYFFAKASQTQQQNRLIQAILIGLSIDMAIFIAANTLDLSWQSGLIPLGFILILAGMLLQQAGKTAESLEKVMKLSWGQASILLLVGPWLALQLLIFQSPGYFGSAIGLEMSAAGALILVGNALSLITIPFAGKTLSSRTFSMLGIGILVAALYALPDSSGILAAVLLLAGQVIASLALYKALHASTSQDANEGMGSNASMLGIGMILFVLLIFIYYATYDINFGIRSNLIPPITAILMLVASLIPSIKVGESDKEGMRRASLIVALLIVVPLVKWAMAGSPPDYTASNNSVRVMDYNLHNAVNTSGVLDPEALAVLIEDSGAEIVGLQEVSRGWLTWGGLDMLTWLSQRLDMHYVWGPTGDAQWGNAILSRYPISNSDSFDLPPRDVLLLRGFISAQIDVGGRTLNVIDTHFSHRDDHDDERLLQASAILEGWDQHSMSVVMGDLNALPSSDEIQLLVNNGLVDISAEIGNPPNFTYHADDPDHQIDYILVSPDLGFSDFAILQSSASDHLPLITTIELGN